ncbi:hypothetical protein [Mucisphaera calidilacus]|uniref:PEP-CTERM protein-sorting domain-containing protein n=1 Tax=Mucisphaera calidilacus TaxID=2527982 RepID=A0A518BU90_9BACT|nr:hypothetical protein [Mucisphaera calidilacus]QDU70565.1 hypothetical protein Pan265_03930 [Mucisphaera calidilacus]
MKKTLMLMAAAMAGLSSSAVADVTYTFDDVEITATQTLVFSDTFVIDTTVGESFSAVRFTFDWTSIGDDPEDDSDGAFSSDLGFVLASDNNFLEFGFDARLPGTFSDDLPLDDFEVQGNLGSVEDSGAGYSLAFQMFDDSLFGSTSILVSDIRMTLLNDAIDVPTLAELALPTPLPVGVATAGDTSTGSTDDVDGRFGPGPSTNYSGADDVYALDWLGGDLQLNLDFDDTVGDLDLFLFDDTDTLVRRSANVGGPESLIEPGLAGGTYYVVVDGWQGDAAPYTLLAQEFTEIPGDYNVDGVLSLGDLDDLFAALVAAEPDLAFDANEDGVLNSEDVNHWVTVFYGSMPGDANLDFAVDLLDLSALAANFETDGQPFYDQGNFNGDEFVDLLDLSLLASSFGFVALVPEPASALLGLGGLLALRRRG